MNPSSQDAAEHQLHGVAGERVDDRRVARLDTQRLPRDRRGEDEEDARPDQRLEDEGRIDVVGTPAATNRSRPSRAASSITARSSPSRLRK
jgi:hypothetical protein